MKRKYIKLYGLSVSCLLSTLLGFTNVLAKAVDIPKPNQYETRCGWFSNPTPANASLFDRDGEWIIGVQGGHQAEGDWPDFSPKQWVKTNVHYGYGCACLQLKVNRETHEVLDIRSTRPRPLWACRKDRSLSKMGFK